MLLSNRQICCFRIFFIIYWNVELVKLLKTNLNFKQNSPLVIECYLALQHHTLMWGVCVWVHACVRGLVFIDMLMCPCTLCLQLKQQQFPMVSVLRLFRGLGLRGVQIPAARLLGEKGFLWYAPDQRWDARDPSPQGNHRSDWSSEYRANCSDNNIASLKSTLSISRPHRES